MFLEIFRFEVGSGFRRPSVHLYFGLLFLLTFMIGLAAADVFSTTRSDSILLRNSPLAVAETLLGATGSLFSLLAGVLLISVMATSIQRDYQYNTHPFFFTKPISKPGYFFGRFLGSFVVALYVFSGLLLGYMAGAAFGLGKPMMAPFDAWAHLQPFLLFTVPNILFQGVTFFALTTFLRTTMAAYVTAIVLMVLSIVSGTITADIDNRALAALLEPTGDRALGLVTEYWSPVERNTRGIPLEGALLHNRLLWTGISLLITLFSYRGFQFTQFLTPLRLFARKRGDGESAGEMSSSPYVRGAVHPDFGTRASLQRLAWLTAFEFRRMAGSAFYVIMVVLSAGVLALVIRFMDAIFEAPTWMVTYKVTEAVEGSTALFLLIFVVFQSGTSVWRDRESRMDELAGVTPVGDAWLFLSRLLAMLLSALLMLGAISAIGATAQLYSGVREIDAMQYAVMAGRMLAGSAVFMAFALSMQSIVSNKYLGFFLTLVPIIILPIVLGLLQWNNPFVDFNGNGESLPYSDMNGYGGSFLQWPFYRAYWCGITGALAMLALSVAPRGKERGLKARWRLTGTSLRGIYLRAAAGLLFVSTAAAAFIYYQTRILQDATSPKQMERELAEVEKRYGRYRRLPQPRISAVSLEVDIFPDSKEFSARGAYTLVNRTAAAMDTLYVDYPGGRKSSYRLAVLRTSMASRVAVDDSTAGIRILKLSTALAPGDSMRLEFDLRYRPRGLFGKSGAAVVDNGTFINSAILPSIGYNVSSELSQNRARKEYGLPPKARMASLEDTAALMNNYIARDADWIRFEAVLSTEEGQTAIAPGYLQREWKQDGRHYFHYRMDSPILHFYSFLSARYKVLRDRWKDVAIEIYHHEGHEYNLQRMVRGIKRSLEYYTANFGPYQHRQVRILEFPRYASFAQSFPNTIPYSEAIGFITRVKEDEDAIDVPFYVTAHEVAHQWWAHQVIGGDVQGGTLLSETLSQYSALMVMQREYGKDAMRKFLRYEMDRYLLGRTVEGVGEMPLMRCENQQYIHYNKGSVVMYSLMDYLGEDTLNAAIRSFLEKRRFSGPPYPHAREFVEEMRAATPDSLKYIIADLFEGITIYENHVRDLSYVRLPDSTYRVRLTVGSAKFRTDSIGRSGKAQVRDYMDVGIFGEETAAGRRKEKTLLLQRIRMDSPEKTFEFTVKERPLKAGIDPMLKLIDRTPDNNTCAFGTKPKIPDLSPGGGTYVPKMLE